MVVPPLHIDYGDFLLGEKLKKDGSNFVPWHRSLREALDKNGLKWVMHMALGEPLSVFADLDTVEEYHARFDVIENVASTMKSMMCRELRIKLYPIVIPKDMIDETSMLFFEDTELGKHQVLMELFQLRMEEGTNLEDHLEKVTSVVDCLVNQLDCWVEEDVLTHAILRTLPPSYHEDVDRIVRAGANVNLHELKDIIRKMVPVPVASDIIDG